MKKQYSSAQLTIIALRSNDVIATSTFGMASTNSLSSIKGYGGKSFDRYTGGTIDTFEDDEYGPVSIIW